MCKDLSLARDRLGTGLGQSEGDDTDKGGNLDTWPLVETGSSVGVTQSRRKRRKRLRALMVGTPTGARTATKRQHQNARHRRRSGHRAESRYCARPAHRARCTRPAHREQEVPSPDRTRRSVDKHNVDDRDHQNEKDVLGSCKHDSDSDSDSGTFPPRHLDDVPY
ncbi:hypothetical protein J1614_001657 [Plenodomus biglobosus]|nr:hypothetical protein J1614_001657 [Plenodomus biglobosus]